MKQKFDLHTHTTISDGSLSPEELVDHAVKGNVKLLSITDHDSIRGNKRAIEKSRKFPIKVIPGVELSVKFENKNLHVCGYFIDVDNTKLKETIQFVQQARKNRNPKMIKKLRDSGIEITLAEVEEESGGEQIGRPHFARVLLHKGYVDSMEEAFTKYVGKGASCYVDKKRLSMEEAIEVIKEAGGTTVLAHPGLLRLEKLSEYFSLFKNLKQRGMKGVEVFSSAHSQEQTRDFYEYSKDLELLMTGGSDFHGENKTGIELGVFNVFPFFDITKDIRKMEANFKSV